MAHETLRIGLGGRAGSGKTSIANLLHAGWGLERFAFADALKDDLSDMEGIDRDKYDHPESKEALRRGMQVWGHYQRLVDPEHWIKRSGILTCPRSFVVSDVRYQNKIDAVHSLGGVCVWVANDEAENAFAPRPEAQDASEQLTAGAFDHVVENCFGRPQDTMRNVCRLLWSLGHPAIYPAAVHSWAAELWAAHQNGKGT